MYRLWPFSYSIDPLVVLLTKFLSRVINLVTFCTVVEVTVIGLRILLLDLISHDERDQTIKINFTFKTQSYE